MSKKRQEPDEDETETPLKKERKKERKPKVKNWTGTRKWSIDKKKEPEKDSN